MDIYKIIKDFFELKSVDKIEGVTIKNISLDSENGSDEWFSFQSREEFNQECLFEDYKFIINKNYERLFDTEDELIEYLEDDFTDYVKRITREQNLDDEEHDKLLDIYCENKFEELLQEYLTNK